MTKNKKIWKLNHTRNFSEKITICAYDAGSANHLLNTYKENISNTKLCLGGPALKIFENHFSDIKIYNLKDSLKDSKYLISGTGWGSSLEHKSRKIASKNGIFNIAVIDHWVNYLERFKRVDEIILPNEIWVTDHEAAKIACKIFSDIPIIQIPNLWLDEIKSRFESIRRNSNVGFNNNLPSTLLYFTEPIRTKWGDVEAGEFQSLRYFFESLEKLSKKRFINEQEKIKEIIIKIHPSEEYSKYDKFLEKLKINFPVKIIDNGDIAKSLAYSEAVFGCETQALVVSLSCGLPTFCTIPPFGPQCRLPHNEIIELRNIH
tara:strand:- start:1393 stop:2346 length:954 start_codon:yes stop_codon:yes gene_type:complete